MAGPMPARPAVTTEDNTPLVLPGRNSDGGEAGRDGMLMSWDAARGGPKWIAPPSSGGSSGGGGIVGSTTFDVTAWAIRTDGLLAPNGWGARHSDYPVGTAPIIVPGIYPAAPEVTGSGTFGVQDAGWYTVYLTAMIGWSGGVGPDAVELEVSQWYATTRLGESLHMRPAQTNAMFYVKGAQLGWHTPPIYLPGSADDTAGEAFSFQFTWGTDTPGTPTDQSGFGSPRCTVILTRLS